jgi:hypothetical protein
MATNYEASQQEYYDEMSERNEEISNSYDAAEDY